MGINISISNTKINDKAKVMANSKFKSNDDILIEMQELDISGQAKLLENLEMDSILNELDQRIQYMERDSYEYYKIQEILKDSQGDKNDFVNCIIKHLGEFSQGVLASVVANLLMGV